MNRIIRVLQLLARACKRPHDYWESLLFAVARKPAVVRFYRNVWLPLLLKRIGRKKTINVVFLAMNPELWRYDGVYRRLALNPRFNVTIVIAMRTNATLEEQLQDQRRTLSYFKGKGYNVIAGYEELAGSWVRLSRLSPDIIFYTQPYKRVVVSAFEFLHNLKSVFCYAPYSFQISKVEWNWNNELQNFCWRHYLPGSYQKMICQDISLVKAQNVKLAGYFLEEEYEKLGNNSPLGEAAWHHSELKRVIWAPHHSIYPDELFKVSSFLEIADLMISLRNEYKGRIVFAFKPHPVLRSRLYTMWGKERTDDYYRNWAESENSFEAQGNYQALFAGSDAMIHCSGSFILEYLYTHKPVQYVYAKSRNPPDLGELGDAALNAHYSAHQEADIREFLDKVVLDGVDTMRSTREQVVDQYLRSPNGKLFSENVYEDLVEGLF